MEALVLIILCVFAILNVILFFKLWRMCDDVRDIANKISPEAREEREREKTEMRKSMEERAKDSFIND